jgi:signal transduction histidine kinase
VVREPRLDAPGNLPKAIEFSVELPRRSSLRFLGPSRLHQALLNLCVNARDAMPAGGKLSIRTDVAAGNTVRRRFPEAAADRYVTVTVSDSGDG